jgi:hypothetical protein
MPALWDSNGQIAAIMPLPQAGPVSDHGSLAPGFTHYNILSSPVLAAVVNPFLDAS